MSIIKCFAYGVPVPGMKANDGHITATEKYHGPALRG